MRPGRAYGFVNVPSDAAVIPKLLLRSIETRCILLRLEKFMGGFRGMGFKQRAKECLYLADRISHRIQSFKIENLAREDGLRQRFLRQSGTMRFDPVLDRALTRRMSRESLPTIVQRKLFSD